MNNEMSKKKNNISKYSIIVPVYNSEKYLPILLESILNQSFDDFEVILVNDGSTDSSGEICDSYAEKDSRIKVLHKQNGGVSSARNEGITMAYSQYIVFVDSDDYLDNTFLENFENSDSDLVISGYVIEDDTHKINKVQDYNESYYSIRDSLPLVKEHFIAGCYNYVWAKRFKRRIIVENQLFFNCDLSIGEDTLFVMDYICNANDISMINIHDYHYVKHERQTLTNQPLSKQLIQRIEIANDAIFEKTTTLFGGGAKRITAKRISSLYRNILIDITNQGITDKDFLSYLFRQKWFKRVVYMREFLSNESWKYRTIIYSRSATLFTLYIKNKKESLS